MSWAQAHNRPIGYLGRAAWKSCDRGVEVDGLNLAADEVAAAIKTSADVQWIVDIDPLDML